MFCCQQSGDKLLSSQKTLPDETDTAPAVSRRCLFINQLNNEENQDMNEVNQDEEIVHGIQLLVTSETDQVETFYDVGDMESLESVKYQILFRLLIFSKFVDIWYFHCLLTDS